MRTEALKLGYLYKYLMVYAQPSPPRRVNFIRTVQSRDPGEFLVDRMFLVLQSAGLVLVHAHSRFVAETPGEGGPHSLLTANQLGDQIIKPSVPLWHFYLDR